MLRLATCKLIERSPRLSTSPKGMTAKVTSAGNSAMQGRQGVQEAVARGRNEIFFGQKLERIGDHRIDQTQTGEAQDRCPVGADAVLDQRAAFALNPAQNAGEIEHHSDDKHRFKGDNREVDDHDAAPPPLPNSHP